MWIAISIVGTLIILTLVTSLITYFIVSYSPKKGQNDLENVISGEQYDDKRDKIVSLVHEFVKIPFTDVQTRAFDGVRLCGKYYHTKDGAPLAICFHGYRGYAQRDYCGGGKFLLEQGFNVLLADHRAHGASGGHSITFGSKESRDVASWCDFAVKQFGNDVKILLYGLSMGAATVLYASALPLPENVLGVFADCPYDSPKEIICKVCKDMKLSAKILYPYIWLGSVLFAGYNPSKPSAAKAVVKTQVPILIVHGEDDRLVPCEMSKRIRDANPEMVRLVTFPNAAHAMSFIEDPAKYKLALQQFIEKLLGEKTE